jgi:hypothetical protein
MVAIDGLDDELLVLIIIQADRAMLPVIRCVSARWRRAIALASSLHGVGRPPTATLPTTAQRDGVFARYLVEAASRGWTRVIAWAHRHRRLRALADYPAVAKSSAEGDDGDRDDVSLGCYYHDGDRTVADDMHEAAARGGHIALIAWLRRRGHAPDERTCAVAARHGRFGVLRWLKARGCPWDARTCAAAARGGHLNVLRWARARRCRWDASVARAAARHRHVDILLWLRARGVRWSAAMCEGAARGGHVDLLAWLRARGCPWGSSTCTKAAEGGHLAALRWLRANGCPWDDHVCGGAAHRGHPHVYEWAAANGCETSYFMEEDVGMGGHTSMFDWVYANGYSLDLEEIGMWAARQGHPQMLQRARERGLVLGPDLYAEATFIHVRFDVLEWLYEAGCPWDGEPCLDAADTFDGITVFEWADARSLPYDRTRCLIKAVRKRNDDIVEWILDHGPCPLDRGLERAAIAAGDLFVLERMRESGYQWSDDACALAINARRANVFMWLHRRGAPLHESACEAAAACDRADALEWLRGHNWPWNERTCAEAARNGSLAALQWAYANGCPCDFEACLEAASAPTTRVAGDPGEMDPSDGHGGDSSGRDDDDDDDEDVDDCDCTSQDCCTDPGWDDAETREGEEDRDQAAETPAYERNVEIDARIVPERRQDDTEALRQAVCDWIRDQQRQQQS